MKSFIFTRSGKGTHVLTCFQDVPTGPIDVSQSNNDKVKEEQEEASPSKLGQEKEPEASSLDEPNIEVLKLP